jgi:hypothetical protein
MASGQPLFKSEPSSRLRKAISHLRRELNRLSHSGFLLIDRSIKNIHGVGGVSCPKSEWNRCAAAR